MHDSSPIQRFNHGPGTKARQPPIGIGSSWNRIQSCDTYRDSYYWLAMQDPRKKKNLTQKASLFQLQANGVKEDGQTSLSLKSRQKGSKRHLMTEVSPPFQKQEGSNSDSLPDSSAAGNEYRALRRKYMLLEDESFALGKEVREVEDEVKTLEDEKFALLDQLIVMEGLVDPTEKHS
ncbi:hypothetical protein AAZX31_01G143100 [Glycine max]|uniref:Uncharacterized protein n=2 Tax=Glycine subgen. Soja TaxID=1462606 RepID=I1J895_SOYBN|nr:uncharacterized protein LOC100784127 [Glycine max]XP_028240199.1 uncharacterized protein LOC114418858 [Glycine soja]KAG5069581.1 hypothetical protein JHK85_001958 [Glycine max]KAG5089292.1 hypothetical protein JHK86_001904 [Glycine max]KAH1163273.1 hypothetical protein GYH30_001695 [Glycine max]KAH1266741.1 hypothetical protein GmHk_01G002154 [Glycine max]KHN28303.1 hypothetical protein glysoja_041769 [Glycine soja]|eukprot:XP_003517112.1 uncharacterized protein LOC100784127 [Glycine max]